MAKLTEDMIIARTKSSDLSAVKKLNCWGSDLEDISLIKRLSNVEVLSLSLNKIKSLAEFQYCRNLVELYVRRNEIRDLSELCYLQDLPRLKRLLLAENPCVETAGAAYRHTVLRCLPNLEVLDNTQVSQDEVDQAFKLGLILEHPTMIMERTSPDPVYYREESPPAAVPVSQGIRRNSTQYDYEDDSPSVFHRSSNSVSHSPPADYYYQQNGSERSRSRTPEPSPVSQQLTNNANNGPINNTNSNGNNQYNSPSRNVAQSVGSAGSGTGGGSSPQSEEQSSSPTNNNGETGTTARRVAHSPDHYRGSNDREMTNGSGSSGHHPQRRASTDYAEMYDDSTQHQIQNNRNVMPHMVHSPSSRVSSQQPLRNKPRTKSSNLLSAVLCLIPELDWQSLEVVELAVRRRMDEMLSD